MQKKTYGLWHNLDEKNCKKLRGKNFKHEK